MVQAERDSDRAPGPESECGVDMRVLKGVGSKMIEGR